ncbi:MAG: TIGR01777 family oxidoreductase [Deltaproteobacteria bacterium]|nr:TIGR01777 family oxidoreductase [Deltaproteobacteria bacterium]
MRVAVTGASGLIGRALGDSLRADGHSVLRLVRGSPAAADERAWDPAAGRLDAAGLEGLDAVVHLAGESIAQERWTAARRERILRSRVDGTTLLARTLAGLRRPPRVLLSGSAVGYYGDRGDELLDETAAGGTGFLADVCRAWEAAAEPASAAGVRVVRLRTGVVLSRRGGALPRMLLPFRLLVGGRLGHGRQWVSWIALDDEVGAIRHLLAADDVAGPVNLTAPRPATNAELARAVGRALRRPAALPTPAAALRLAFGKLASVLLDSTRAAPRVLERSGYVFRHPELAAYLQAELG